MMSKYYDDKTAEHVLLALYKFPFLLEQGDKYFFSADDFTSKFSRVIFASIYNLKSQGLNTIGTMDIENYLSSRPAYQEIYLNNAGSEWLEQDKSRIQLDSFDYYFNRLKKFTILRAFDSFGIDVHWLYDPEQQDRALIQKQNDFIDSLEVDELANKVDQKIEEIKLSFLGKTWSVSKHAGDGLVDLIQGLKQSPEVGIPLYGPLINTVTRGARLKKFYLRSAPTGVGKSRMMMADMCNFACDEIYNLDKKEWVSIGSSEPSLFITTELDIDECQTMGLAFLSGVSEDNILNGVYYGDEENRVFKAAHLLSNSPLWIEHLPDFSLRDIEAVIRRNVRDNGVRYVAFDYIHTSLKILEEITQRTRGMKLREDNILFMIAIKIKDLCNELGIFILSGTQLNSDWENRDTSNQNVLRGAKAIADKIDLGIITLPVSEQDKEALAGYVQSSCLPMPNLVHHVYKNRRGRFKSVKLWCYADLSICRVNPLFLTDNDYKPISIDDIDIIVDNSIETVLL
jgi:replicative DNA helicase